MPRPKKSETVVDKNTGLPAEGSPAPEVHVPKAVKLNSLQLWTGYNIELEFMMQAVGGIPANPEMIQAWLRAKMPAADEARIEELAKATVGELPKKADDVALEDAKWNTFKVNGKGEYGLEARCVKALFKETANILKDVLIKAEQRGGAEKSRFQNFKSKLAERLFIEGDLIPFTRDGQTLLKPDGRDERPISVMTMQGPRTSIKRYEFFNPGVRLNFNVRVLDSGLIDDEVLSLMLEHGEFNGLGSDRSQGAGQFRVVKVKRREVPSKRITVED